MEEEPTDPHEQQLYAVFKSCLAEGQSKLDKDGLLALCNKLELEENNKDAILQLLEIDNNKKFVSFYEFRDGFLALLGKSQEALANNSEKEVNGESQIIHKNNTMCTRYNNQSAERKQSETMNCQQLHIDKIFDHQRLQETWSNQNSLTIEDVNSFCNRGSALPKQTIELIFEKLDIDCDGLINLDEFLHFFQNTNSKLQEQSNINWSTYSQRDHSKTDCCKDFVHSISGHVLRSVIIELWEVAGVTEANSLLLELGFDAPTINLIDLSNALSSELKLHRDVTHAGGAGEYVRLLRGALVLSQEEVRSLNTSMEQLRCERDKLRLDIGEANERANLLAQEIDDHQMRMDKARQEQLRQLEIKHTEALKDLTNQLHLEREKNTSSLKLLEEQLQTSQQEEQRIRCELATVLKELKLLETENQNQNEVINKLETCNNQLTRQVQELAAAHEQVESIETKENEQVTDLMSHIKRLQAEMKILRDNNDELNSELEMLKHRDSDAKSIVSSVDIRSTLSDENDGLVSMPTTEVSDTEDDEKQHQSKYYDHSKINKVNNVTKNKVSSDDSSNGHSINKLNEIIQEFRNFLTGAKFCAECSSLRSEVSSLINELELYQASLPIIPDESITNKRKKQTRNLANELVAEYGSNQRAVESFRDVFFSRNDRFKHYKRISSSDDTLHDFDHNLDNLNAKFIPKNKLLGLRDSLSCNTPDNNSNASQTPKINNLDKNSQDDEMLNALREKEFKYAAEKEQLLEKISDLEKSLELLKSEYEQCEDYWSSKLEEERIIFEQEQKISDDKFSELIEKVAEYEEQFNGDKKNGRLSPIEEKVDLEQQYNDLEEEFEKWKIEAQEELNKKEKEIEELKEKLNSMKRLSLNDISVQFPDEQMKNIYPTLYSALCSPSSSTESCSNGEATVPDAPSNFPQQCSQCHNLRNNCNCHANKHQNSHQQQGERSRRGDGRGRHHHHHHHHQKKADMDPECTNLVKQKEKLKQEIMKLQNLKTINANHIYPLIGTEDQNILSNLCAKLYAQEQKHKCLQVFYQSQQKENERIMQEMWNQHLLETSDLRFVIKSTEDKLNHQIKLNKEQCEKLTKADFLTKELYVENAQLSETIKRLEQHCQILTQNRVDTTTA